MMTVCLTLTAIASLASTIMCVIMITDRVRKPREASTVELEAIRNDLSSLRIAVGLSKIDLKG